MPLYKADDLFSLVPLGPEQGMPPWANLGTRERADSNVDFAELLGPGIYALFLDDALFYIGIHAPSEEPVTARWHKHIVSLPMRASRNFMSRAGFLASLTLPGPVGDGLRACLSEEAGRRLAEINRDHSPLTPGWTRAMRDFAPAGPDEVCAPLKVRGYQTTYNKARFADMNWDVLGPDNDADLLSHISCGYERFTPGTDIARSDIKKELERREAVLIDTFKPICNRQTQAGLERTGIRWPEVQAAILASF